MSNKNISRPHTLSFSNFLNWSNIIAVISMIIALISTSIAGFSYYQARSTEKKAKDIFVKYQQQADKIMSIEGGIKKINTNINQITSNIKQQQNYAQDVKGDFNPTQN